LVRHQLSIHAMRRRPTRPGSLTAIARLDAPDLTSLNPARYDRSFDGALLLLLLSHLLHSPRGEEDGHAQPRLSRIEQSSAGDVSPFSPGGGAFFMFGVSTRGGFTMTRFTGKPLGIFYEHPDWYRPLFHELDRRQVPYDAVQADRHSYDPSDADPPHAIVFNRMSPSAHTRGGAHLISYTLQYLSHLERLGVRVINGYAAWRTEISKAYQLTLLERLGLPYPRARVIHHPSQASDAAAGLRFPVVVKPNIGGSGAGIVRFDDPEALARASRAETLNLGLDSTALVQEYIAADAGRIVRVEILDRRYLYAIRIYTSGDSFNLCPADVCQSVDGAELARVACAADAPKNTLRVESYTPSPETINAVERIMAASGIEIGGVEYMIDPRDGRAYFYDINALSNFIADAPRVLGFDPFARLADWLEAELVRVGAASPATRVHS
jgi:hypothetical protein